VIFKRRIRRLLPCILEVILLLKSRNLKPTPELIAERLGVKVDSVVRAIELAIRDGLIDSSSYDLTDRGRELVLRHRERFLHDRLVHKYSYPWSAFLRGKDISAHWSSRHGLDREGLSHLHSQLSSLNVRIEDVKPLSSLSPGSKGIVAFMVGGYGFIRRLADMGLTPGVEVSVVRNAPFGGPVIVQVRGSFLALGRGVASRIFIKTVEE